MCSMVYSAVNEAPKHIDTTLQNKHNLKSYLGPRSHYHKYDTPCNIIPQLVVSFYDDKERKL